MRVTESMLFNNAKVRNGLNRDRMEKAMAETSTGRRVVHPWDDPVAAGRIAYHNNKKVQWQGVMNSAQRGISELQSADEALQSIQYVVGRAYEIAVQLQNGSFNHTDRQTAAVELETLKEEVIYFLNTSIGGRYIFGGIEDDQPPFDTQGNFQGSDIQRIAEIAPGLTTESSVSVSKYFTNASGGVDLFDSLDILKSGLENSDGNDISQAIGDLKTSIGQISNARAEAGTQQHFFELAFETGMLIRDKEGNRSSELGDTDIIDSATRLQMAERALEASLTASVKSFRLTLLDKM